MIKLMREDGQVWETVMRLFALAQLPDTDINAAYVNIRNSVDGEVGVRLESLFTFYENAFLNALTPRHFCAAGVLRASLSSIEASNAVIRSYAGIGGEAHDFIR